ncbi:cell division protein FtsZ [Adhaeribacter sp. BT258]|uniref:Cell division protein FtsZ n=1 Tax=Adhaeribacter terrigena TaxID=2793070 RepID=A0ABS1C0U1_9BACT|nr:cell division protein FtsZ [Adhaeribacter terrigena]MBK0402213.1 cell division protein FtsZ [Adhaeribacter terrigena]
MSFSPSYKFDVPSQSKSIIKVIGVGGGGSNAVNHMFGQGIKDVEFVVCNTDAQALKSSSVPNKLQIGIDLTEGLGAGANPERGKQAAIESKEQIRELLGTDTKMVFITAGMGGGTGTGAAPVIAKVAKDLDILTVGIVTAPFMFEGRKKRQAADNGIKELSDSCDTVLVILNDKLREIFGNLPIRSAFAKADNVLTTAAKSIAEIITVTSEVNVDFEDVKTVMKDSGAAVMGSAITEGENRALRAAEEALSSPLLNNTDIHGAQKILLSIMSGDQAELEMDELTEITEYIQEQAGEEAEVIFGHGIDPELGQSIRVTVIATGFAREGNSIVQMPAIKKIMEKEAAAPAPQNDIFNTDYNMAAEAPVKPVTPPQPTYTPPAPQYQAPEPVRAPQPQYVPPVQQHQPQQVQPQQPMPQQPQGPVSQPDNIFAEPVPNRVIYDLGVSQDVVNHDMPNLGHPQPQYQPQNAPIAQTVDIYETQERIPSLDERRRRLRQLSSEISSDAIKEKLEVPAYQRRNVVLENVVPSAERNISRFSLNDDNEILGDNRFLHDNVD